MEKEEVALRILEKGVEIKNICTFTKLLENILNFYEAVFTKSRTEIV